MENRKTILAAVDLGPETEAILSYSVWLSGTLGGAPEINILNVMDYALTPPAYLLPYLEKEEEAGGQEMKKWVDRVRLCGIGATGRIAVGRLIETFSKTMLGFNTAVLVLGHKSHIIRSSSSERMIKSLDVPMLVVRGRKADGAALGSVALTKILCAVDFSESSRQALEFASVIAAENSASLLAAHIVPGFELDRSFGGPRGFGEKDKQEYRDHAVQEAERLMSSAAGLPDKAERVVRIGVPYKAINDIASERNIDLIVIGAQGVSETRGVLLGSIAEALVKSSPCPVMLVRR